MVLASASALLAVWLFAGLVRKLLVRLFPPTETEAVVIAKRIEVKTKDSSKKTHTLYYITFQSLSGGLPSGERREYKTSSSAFGLSAEGDKGALRVHMGKFLKFERNK